jgi:hypothetical protein
MRANRFIMNGLTLLCVALLFIQCDKDEPSLEATLETTIGLTSNAAAQGKLTIENASIRIAQIEVVAEGTDGNQTRVTAENPEANNIITLTGGENSTPFNFDVKIGKYDPVTLYLTSEEDPYTLSFPTGPGGAPDFADFLANASPSIVFSGTFTNRGESIRVYVGLDVTNRLTFPAFYRGTPQVSFAANNRAKISIDPTYILLPLSTQRLEDATTFDYQGQKTIFIHPQFNTDIYIDIEERMFDTRNFIKADIFELGNG